MVCVALSRVRSLDRMQVLGLRPAICIAPCPAVTAFAAVQSAPAQNDAAQCCRHIAFEAERFGNDMGELFGDVSLGKTSKAGV